MKGVHRTTRCHPGTDIPLQHPWNTFTLSVGLGVKIGPKTKRRVSLKENVKKPLFFFFFPWEKVIDFLIQWASYTALFLRASLLFFFFSVSCYKEDGRIRREGKVPHQYFEMEMYYKS